jgi:cytidylate kinase
MVRRDKIDSTRDVAPLRPAADAVVIDTSELSVEQVVERVLALVRKEGRPARHGLA